MLAGRRTPLPDGVLLEHERYAEGGEDGGEGIASDERPERGRLEHRPEHRDHHRGHEESEPEVSGGGDGGGAHEAAEHDEVAVGEVHHVHDAEDEGEAGRDEGEDHPVDDAVDGLDEDLLERNGHGGYTPRYWWMTAWLARRSAEGAWWRTTPFSMM